MKHNICLLIIAGTVVAILSGCASKEQIRQTIQENPDLVYEAIRKDPVKFMKVVQEAAQSSQEQMYVEMQKQREEQLEKDLKKPRSAKTEDARVLFGEKAAPVTIIKYADFQCPACRMDFDSIEEIKKKYNGKVKIIHKHMPLSQHKQAQLSAEVFEALLISDKAKAQKFYKLAYENQQNIESDKDVWELLKKVGGNKAKVEAEIKKGVVAQRINDDVQEHHKLGFNGTPAYMINGVALMGAQEPGTFSAIIERVLKQ